MRRFQRTKEILLGNGSDELIAIILSQAIAKRVRSYPMLTVLAPAPSFVMYKISGVFNHLNGGNTTEYG